MFQLMKGPVGVWYDFGSENPIDNVAGLASSSVKQTIAGGKITNSAQE